MSSFSKKVFFLTLGIALLIAAGLFYLSRSSGEQPFSYAIGCREIERLYADEERRLGPAFSERAFHDKLLRTGAIPFRFVRRLFGYETK